MNPAEQAFLDWRARPSRDALRRLLRANQDRVYSLCFQVLRHAQDAEDASQASLLELARGVERIADPGAFRSWLYRVCLNNALNLRRERRRRMAREERRAAMTPTADALATDDVRDAVHDALARLDDDERALVVEHYFEKATLDDLGSRRGISGPATWKRIEHAKEKMRRALAGVGLSQMNSVLEAAEVTPAPSGFSVEGALAPGARAAILPRVVGAAAFVSVAILTAVMVFPRSTNGGPTATPPATKSSPAPVSAAPPEGPSRPPTPAPSIQEEMRRVVDPDGRPLQGALVFPGRWYRLRGDDAFDLMRPQSIKDGVTTDAEGRFRLEAKSPFLTAWHDDFTPTTVKTSDAAVIRMKARATLRGKLVDAAGKPREGIEVTLDKRGPRAVTDSAGAFQFEKVIAGFRGLILPNYRWVAVRVDPGETLNLEIGPGVDVTLDLGDHPLGPGTQINGGLMGVTRTTSLVGIRGQTPTMDLKGVLPGRYLFGEIRGARGWVDISDKGAKVEFGKATLEITAEAETTFYFLPAEANEIIEVAIMKMGELKTGPGAPLRMEHLMEGDYELRDREGVTLERFKVGPGETRVTLKSK